MHIAHFTNTYKPNLNGVSRSVNTFRWALSRQGHQIFVFAQETRNYEDDEPFIFRYPGIDLHRFDYSFTLPVSPFIDWVFPLLKVDVVHSNHPVLLGKSAAEKAEKYNLPLVFTFHSRYTGYDYYLPLNKSFVRGVIVDGLANYLQRCQHVITPSESIRKILRDYGGITERVTTIPTGIELEPFQQADPTPVRQRYNLEGKRLLVSTGRLAPEKNWRTMLAAFAEVCRQFDDTYLMVIGDGIERSDLQDLAYDLGVIDRTIFTGGISFEEIPTHLRAADVFCYASVIETQGLVTMEALAAGLPVVAVGASGTRDTVEDGVQGLLTENDSHALAQAICRILSDEHLRERFRGEALRKAMTFDCLVQAEKLTAVYQQAIEDKAAGRSVLIDRDLLKERRDQLGLSLAEG